MNHIQFNLCHSDIRGVFSTYTKTRVHTTNISMECPLHCFQSPARRFPKASGICIRARGHHRGGASQAFWILDLRLVSSYLLHLDLDVTMLIFLAASHSGLFLESQRHSIYFLDFSLDPFLDLSFLDLYSWTFLLDLFPWTFSWTYFSGRLESINKCQRSKSKGHGNMSFDVPIYTCTYVYVYKHI